MYLRLLLIKARVHYIKQLETLKSSFDIRRRSRLTQPSVLTGLGGVVRGLGLLSGYNSDHNGPAASSTAP